MASYKQKCIRCKKNYVLTNWRNKFPVCYDCEKKELSREIEDPKMKEMFNIPEEYYKDNSFLRDIKKNYLRYNNLSEKQIEAFKKVVENMETK